MKSIHDLEAQADQVNGLRVLMVAPQPFFRARGTPFSVLHRVRALVESGHHVDLVTYPFGEDVPMKRLRVIRTVRPPLVKDVKIGPSAAKLALEAPMLWSTVRALARHRYDLIHSHEEAAFFVVPLARRHRLPHIYDMHSSLPQQLANFCAYNFGAIRRLFERLERWVLTTCDGVITICPELGDIAMEICGDTPHAMIENTADDTKVFARTNRDVRGELGLGDDEIVLYTGTFESYQGLDLLLDAFALLTETRPRASLLMVGGRPPQVEAHRDKARSLGIGDRVTFTGTVHPSQIPDLLDTAAAIASPRSTGNNTPLKIYGYLRSGRPLVATDLPTHTQTLDSSVARLVPPEPRAFANGLEAVLADPGYAARIGAAAAARAQAQFSDDAYVDKVLALYEAVMGPRARPRSGEVTRVAGARGDGARAALSMPIGPSCYSGKLQSARLT